MITVLITAPVALPVLCAVLYGLAGWRRPTAWVGAGVAAAVLACGIALATVVSAEGPYVALNGALRVDAVSAFLVIVIGAAGLLATGASPAFLRAEIRAGQADEALAARVAGRHSLLVQAFVAATTLAVLAANLGVLAVGVEVAVIAAAFLIVQGRSRLAREAAWKFLLGCSVGMALAFLGLVLLNGTAGLDWTALATNASTVDRAVLRIAVALLIVGFGAVAGLAPLHGWLPDAHSQAPAPVAALLSGVLLSVAFGAILRVKVIADAALGAGFTRTLLIIMALATLAVSASLSVAQREYKRMLAYAGMAHVALLALGAAAGSRFAVAAVLLLLFGHGLARAVLFLASGRILQLTGSRQAADVRGLATRDPVLAAVVGLGVLALLGFPPFATFAGQLGILRAGFGAGVATAVATGIALVPLLVVTAAVLTGAGRMLVDTAPVVEGPGAATAPERTPLSTAAALGGGLAICAVTGITAAGPLQHLLSLAADILTGTP
jgi:hydrogenase-4 component F